MSGKKERPTMIRAEHEVAEDLLLFGKGPGGLSRQQDEHEPAACTGSKGTARTS